MPSIPKRYLQRPAEYLAASNLVHSGALERRATQLERGLPPEPPVRRRRLLAGGTTPTWALDPDELREAPPASALVEVDMTAVIRRRLVDSARHAKARRYLDAAVALADAEQLVTRHAPALRELRRRAELERHRLEDERRDAVLRAGRQKGAAAKKQRALRKHARMIRAARKLRKDRPGMRLGSIIARLRRDGLTDEHPRNVRKNLNAAGLK